MTHLSCIKAELQCRLVHLAANTDIVNTEFHCVIVYSFR